MRVILEQEELFTAVYDYLEKQGLKVNKEKSVLFSKEDNSLVYGVEKAEVSIETQ